MTEQMAIEIIRRKHCSNSAYCTDNCLHGKEFCAYSLAIQSLEDTYHHKSNGSVEEFKKLKEKNEPKKVSVFKKYRYGYMLDACFCTVCNNFICFIEELNSTGIKNQYKYCVNCGQAVKF